jgi:hypothetical protein
MTFFLVDEIDVYACAHRITILETMVEVQSQPRNATGFVQFCGTCGKNQMFKVDTLGWKICTVCSGTAPDRGQSPI